MTLTEEQQDKVFAILHAAAPQLREHMKAARKAHDALRDLGRSAEFDSGKAALLAQSQAAAESQLALLHTRTEHDIYLVLTPEQRAHLADREHEHASHAQDGPAPPP
jgi:Spy/CpxP family protein refolding chaperone